MQLLGGFACGAAAGFAANFGRLCTFAAIEDAVVAGDLRRARAWALTVAVALAATQALYAAGIIDLAGNPYAYTHIELGALVVGGLLFGLGMSLVGTCGFGILVRAGSGDLRALITGLILGIAAFAATAGVLSGVRLWIASLVTFESALVGSATFRGLVRHTLGQSWAGLPAVVFPTLLAAFALSHHRFRRRKRLIAASLILGAAVAAGWYVTSALADPFANSRPESLTFVAPLGRAVLTIMGETFASAHFAVASVAGVIAGSFAVAVAQGNFRWEAFDDQREMRRHLLGGVLMGLGGVLARGCTIGQGVSAASTMAMTAPIAVACMILGARLGLFYLIEGRSILGAWFDRMRGGGTGPSPSRRFDR